MKMKMKMTNKTIRSEAQIAAEQRNDEKRKGSPRLPTARLSEEESAVMENLYLCFGSKKEAVLAAAKFYLKNNK